MGLSDKEAPFIEPYALAGNPKGFKSKGNTKKAVWRALAHLGFLPWKNNDEMDSHWNVTTNDAVAAWKRKRGLIPADSNDGSWGQKAHDVMLSAWYMKDGQQLPAFDGGSQKLLQEEKAGQAPPPDKVPDLGPVSPGGLSVLDHDLTHASSGMPTNAKGVSLWPAFDDTFSAKPTGGVKVYAPDDLEVYLKDSSANPGEAMYLKGAQKVDFWLGHIDRDYSLGTKFARGAYIAETVDTTQGGGPHSHWAVNVERLLGAGMALEHHTNYTHGAPLIGDQLARLLK